MKALSLFLGLALAIAAAVPRLHAADSTKPVLLFSRYFNAVGDTRYTADGAYKEVLARLSADFEIRSNDAPLTKASLAGVKVLLIANPNDTAVGTNPPPHHADATDAELLQQFVRNGGGLVLLGNQENHNLEVNDMNKVIGRFGLQETNVYTDAKLIAIPRSAPVIGGLKWGYYTGNSILLDSSNPAKPFSFVTNDLKQPPAKGPRDAAGILMAGAKSGKGRVLVSTDSGWLADWSFNDKGVGGVSLKGQQNWEICRRLMLWVAGRE